MPFLFSQEVVSHRRKVFAKCRMAPWRHTPVGHDLRHFCTSRLQRPVSSKKLQAMRAMSRFDLLHLDNSFHSDYGRLYNSERVIAQNCNHPTGCLIGRNLE